VLAHTQDELLLPCLVKRLGDADLLCAGDGDALTALAEACFTAEGQNRREHVEAFVRCLEDLVVSGDLAPAEVLPALTEARRLLGPAFLSR
jgi:hypothetical protein